MGGPARLPLEVYNVQPIAIATAAWSTHVRMERDDAWMCAYEFAQACRCACEACVRDRGGTGCMY